MIKKQKINKKGCAVIYKVKDGQIELEVKLQEETIWLTQAQIALLFGTQRPAITKHLNNIFKSKELDKNSVCSILEHTAADGKKYKTQIYNLDAIISIGYRVNSQKATQFRIWATKILKQYLAQGYAINEKRLIEVKEKFNQLRQTINFLQKKSQKKLLKGQEQEILNLLADYSKTLSLLRKYDRDELKVVKGAKTRSKLEYIDCKEIILGLKKKLIAKKEAGDLFGNEVGAKLEGILGNIYQTFDNEELYKTIEEKAANFLYLTIKDHPLTDGNKRVASFLFVYFLDKNNYLYRETGEKKINDNALTALALLVAESKPKEKEQLIALITQLLK
ncbi:MAG: virulence protein RhuM/Fic/DOC family protein [bacterium]